MISLVDAAAGRTFLTDSGAVHRLGPADWSPALLDGVGRLHLSGYLLLRRPKPSTRPSWHGTRRSGRGVTVSLDPASSGFLADLGVERFLATAEGVDVLLPNADEAAYLTGLPEPANAAAKLSRQFPLVVVTLGPAGALVASRGVTSRVPAPEARGPRLHGRGRRLHRRFPRRPLAGAAPAAAAEAGCRAGALAVTQAGGRPRGGVGVGPPPP